MIQIIEDKEIIDDTPAAESVSYKLSVMSVIWQRPAYTVFSGKTEDGERIRIVAKGERFSPTVGEIYQIIGIWAISPKYGRQLYGHAAEFRRLLPSRTLVIPWLQRFHGLGPDRAHNLVAHFNGNLEHAFGGGVPVDELAAAIDPTRPNLSARVAAAIQLEWQQVRSEFATISWLEEQGIEDIRTARRIADLLGQNAIETLTKNPYVMANVLPWTKVDEIGERILRRQPRIEDPKRCSERILGAVDAIVQDDINEGHTAVLKEGFINRVANKLNLRVRPDLADRILHLGVKNWAIVDGGDRWRAPGCAAMESYLHDRFRQMANGKEGTRIRLPPERDLARILAMVERRGRALFDEQRTAVLKLIQSPLGCLVGGAGTGKTATCRAIVHLWEALGGRVELAALSAVAAQRLTDGAGRTRNTDRPAATIEKFLIGLSKREEGQTHWGKNPSPPLTEADPSLELPLLSSRALLVVDEASMVDLGLMHRLVHAMPDGCHLLLVGDEHQLPPISFGLVFHRLVTQQSITARLNVIRRAEGVTGIPEASEAIRHLSTPVFRSFDVKADGVSFIRVSEGQIGPAVQRIVDSLGGFDAEHGNIMIVAAVNNRPRRPDGTVREFNRMFHGQNTQPNRESGGTELKSVKGWLGNYFAVGDPVSYTKNDYSVGLRNGSMGIVKVIDTIQQTVTVKFDIDTFEFSRKSLINLTLAYAMSCHRAQGSQAETVIISLADAPNIEPTWIYTALTRAQKKAIFVGEMAIFEAALRRTPAYLSRIIGCSFDLLENDNCEKPTS
ncbi:exodeoxyribonuclease V alpha subunit [Skermanella aerolata]|uniref:AAA family ATPase n=1 Tax=Skermanella aerolata TaxID=393310 RepID=UPI003D1FD517